MDFRLLSSRVRTSGDGSSPVTQQLQSAMSAWRSGAESRPAWLQSRSTSVNWACFLRLHHEIPGMRVGVENGFGKSGKQRIGAIPILLTQTPFELRFAEMLVRSVSHIKASNVARPQRPLSHMYWSMNRSLKRRLRWTNFAVCGAHR